MKPTWRTFWQQHDIVVLRDEIVVDRLPASGIARVLFVYRGAGDNPGDIERCIVELAGDDGFALFEPDTGFAGRVNFERQAFWRERGCVYWVSSDAATLPWRLRFAAWRGDGASRAFRRLAREELAASIARWPLEGPETWDERKLHRIERKRPFGHTRSAQG
jgi:hypothetical protein